MDLGDLKHDKLLVPATATAVERIKHLRVKRYLDAVDEKRAWLLAAQSLSQTQLAAAMGVSQPYVSNMLRKARADVGEQPRPGFHGSSAYEIAARYRLGELDRSTMLDELTRWTYATPPADTAEQTVVAIYAEIFNARPDTIGVTDSFFDLGGNSLSATRAIARIADRFGRRFTFRDFAAAGATPRGVVTRLRQLPADIDASPDVPLDTDVWRADGHVPTPGSFTDEVGRAFDAGLLTDDDYDELVDRWADH